MLNVLWATHYFIYAVGVGESRQKGGSAAVIIIVTVKSFYYSFLFTSFGENIWHEKNLLDNVRLAHLQSFSLFRLISFSLSTGDEK